jgi:hypothetical protein
LTFCKPEEQNGVWRSKVEGKEENVWRTLTEETMAQTGLLHQENQEEESEEKKKKIMLVNQLIEE